MLIYGQKRQGLWIHGQKRPVNRLVYGHERFYWQLPVSKFCNNRGGFCDKKKFGNKAERLFLDKMVIERDIWGIPPSPVRLLACAAVLICLWKSWLPLC